MELRSQLIKRALFYVLFYIMRLSSQKVVMEQAVWNGALSWDDVMVLLLKSGLKVNFGAWKNDEGEFETMNRSTQKWFYKG